jgi:predicted DCC family thiol-disulfide oxidoreductase YuxK
VIIVFDAQCLLCSGWVQFILKHDKRRVFTFTSIQSPSGVALLERAGLRVEDLQTLLLVDGDKSYQHTAALLRVVHQLGWIWRLMWVGWLVPAPLRDAAYRFIARNRYRVLGRREQCFMPSAEDASRFT